MELTHRQFSKVDLIALSGRLDASTAPKLREQFDALFAKGRYRIVLDLAGLNHVNSSGLGVFLDARKRARNWKITDLEGGDVRIANLPPRIRDVFDLTGLTDLFDIYEDTTAAVGSF